MSQSSEDRELAYLAEVLFQAHPWHGVSPGKGAPEVVEAFIEIVPTDAVKYELDKPSGHLRVDRPQRYSSMPPSLYGFIPQTYCADLTAARSKGKASRGDGDPLDICVLTENPITHGDILLAARPIGGLRMIDGEEADDKIIAVLDKDLAYGTWRDLGDIPKGLLDRLRHYFMTYKEMPDSPKRKVEIDEIYGRGEAHEVIRASLTDYRNSYGDPEQRLPTLRRLLTRR
jgi:inorganic pyrophosphatase